MADWREELKNAYDKSADEKVKQSNAVYQKKMAQVLGDTLSRGLGRSSYATATQANLMKDMIDAGNQIETDFRLEYLKALQDREARDAELAERMRQFDLSLAANAGGGGGGYGGSSSYYPSTQNPKPESKPSTSWLDSLNNWQGLPQQATHAPVYTGTDKIVRGAGTDKVIKPHATTKVTR